MKNLILWVFLCDLSRTEILEALLDIIHVICKAQNISLYTKTEPLYRTIGLKQGDISSTIFSNLFINDLLSLLADNNYGDNGKPKLGDTNKSSMLFADDLTIFLLSQKEL